MRKDLVEDTTEATNNQPVTDPSTTNEDTGNLGNEPTRRDPDYTGGPGISPVENSTTANSTTDNIRVPTSDHMVMEAALEVDRTHRGTERLAGEVSLSKDGLEVASKVEGSSDSDALADENLDDWLPPIPKKPQYVEKTATINARSISQTQAENYSNSQIYSRSFGIGVQKTGSSSINPAVSAAQAIRAADEHNERLTAMDKLGIGANVVKNLLTRPVLGLNLKFIAGTTESFAKFNRERDNVNHVAGNLNINASEDVQLKAFVGNNLKDVNIAARSLKVQGINTSEHNNINVRDNTFKITGTVGIGPIFPIYGNVKLQIGSDISHAAENSNIIRNSQITGENVNVKLDERLDLISANIDAKNSVKVEAKEVNLVSEFSQFRNRKNPERNPVNVGVMFNGTFLPYAYGRPGSTREVHEKTAINQMAGITANNRLDIDTKDLRMTSALIAANSGSVKADTASSSNYIVTDLNTYQRKWNHLDKIFEPLNIENLLVTEESEAYHVEEIRSTVNDKLDLQVKEWRDPNLTTSLEKALATRAADQTSPTSKNSTTDAGFQRPINQSLPADFRSANNSAAPDYYATSDVSDEELPTITPKNLQKNLQKNLRSTGSVYDSRSNSRYNYVDSSVLEDDWTSEAFYTGRTQELAGDLAIDDSYFDPYEVAIGVHNSPINRDINNIKRTIVQDGYHWTPLSVDGIFALDFEWSSNHANYPSKYNFAINIDSVINNLPKNKALNDSARDTLDFYKSTDRVGVDLPSTVQPNSQPSYGTLGAEAPYVPNSDNDFISYYTSTFTNPDFIDSEAEIGEKSFTDFIQNNEIFKNFEKSNLNESLALATDELPTLPDARNIIDRFEGVIDPNNELDSKMPTTPVDIGENESWMPDEDENGNAFIDLPKSFIDGLIDTNGNVVARPSRPDLEEKIDLPEVEIPDVDNRDKDIHIKQPDTSPTDPVRPETGDKDKPEAESPKTETDPGVVPPPPEKEKPVEIPNAKPDLPKIDDFDKIEHTDPNKIVVDNTRTQTVDNKEEDKENENKTPADGNIKDGEILILDNDHSLRKMEFDSLTCYVLEGGPTAILSSMDPSNIKATLFSTYSKSILQALGDSGVICVQAGSDILKTNFNVAHTSYGNGGNIGPIPAINPTAPHEMDILVVVDAKVKQQQIVANNLLEAPKKSKVKFASFKRTEETLPEFRAKEVEIHEVPEVVEIKNKLQTYGIDTSKLLILGTKATTNTAAAEVFGGKANRGLNAEEEEHQNQGQKVSFPKAKPIRTNRVPTVSNDDEPSEETLNF